MLGWFPGAKLFQVETSETHPPPLVPTQFPPIDPPAPLDAASAVEASAGLYPPTPGVPAVYYAVAPSSAPHRAPMVRAGLSTLMPTPAPLFYAPIPALDEWPLSRLASSSYSPLRSSVVAPAQSIPAARNANRIDRVQLSSWAMLRSQRMGVAGTQSLAGTGSLGASQAGSRLLYNFNRQIAASMRTTTPVGMRGGEIAAGVRVQPISRVPIWLTAERRQRLGVTGGRNAFAAFVEAGFYGKRLPLRFFMDSYVQAGIVGRDRFVDGALTLTHPITRKVSAGAGVWGAAQPGVSRLDVGPRISLKVRDNVRVHLDWRQKVAGNAKPGSGAAVTLAGDF